MPDIEPRSPLWTDTDSGAVISVCGIELVTFDKVYIPIEQRLESPMQSLPDIDVSTRLTDTGQARPVGEGDHNEDGWLALKLWADDRWLAALDCWLMFGEPLLVCEHYDHGVRQGDEICFWFPRFPAAMMCADCGSKVANAIDSAPGSCDYCHDESQDYEPPLVVTGATIAVPVVLCRVCCPIDTRAIDASWRAENPGQS